MAGHCPVGGAVIALVVMHFVREIVTQTDVCIRVPEKTAKCLMSHEYQPVPRNSLIQSCLEELLWYYPSSRNLTTDEVTFFQGISSRILDNPTSPPSGFRQRMEYRQLSAADREKLHRAFQILYDEGTIHLFGKLFGEAYNTVRHSPAFLGFQRVFLLAFEEELRRIDSSVSLPYWDFTIDTEMDNPVNSIVWSSKMFGNGNGKVKTGDFREWLSPKGPLQRRYGESNYGRLINRNSVRDIVSKCRTHDITFPVQSEADAKYVLEFHFNGVMNWLGGSSADALTAAYDPVFYMLAACTDYIWEVFRKIQEINCNINPSIDYPEHNKQAAFDKMFGFSNFSNVHGYSNYWTTYWYNYTTAPACPNCNYDYAWCNSDTFRCVAQSRRSDFNTDRNSFTEEFEPLAEYIPVKLDIPFMPSPLNDGRTMASSKHDAIQAAIKRKANTQGRKALLFSTVGPPSLFSDALSGSSFSESLTGSD